jgi:hypothetical protein
MECIELHAYGEKVSGKRAAAREWCGCAGAFSQAGGSASCTLPALAIGRAHRVSPALRPQCHIELLRYVLQDTSLKLLYLFLCSRANILIFPLTCNHHVCRPLRYSHVLGDGST